jgi:hypothetical protein
VDEWPSFYSPLSSYERSSAIDGEFHAGIHVLKVIVVDSKYGRIRNRTLGLPTYTGVPYC